MMTSYAGNFEDVLLSRIFRHIEKGFYVDIGACQARLGSASYAFYERGWTGINVEPGDLFDNLSAGRPRDTNIRAAITDKDGEVEFFYHRDSPATSTVFETLSPEVSAHVKDRVRFTVPSLRMSTFVDRYIGDRHVHFLKVDAEGSERDIFSSCDWTKFRPEVIVSEAVKPYTNIPVYEEWSHHLLNAGYRLALFDGINAWFVRDESPPLFPLASVPVNQLDYFSPHDEDKERLKEELAILRENAIKAPKPPGYWQSWRRWLAGLHLVHSFRRISRLSQGSPLRSIQIRLKRWV
jgi:FkbM family methyltransferase